MNTDEIFNILNANNKTKKHFKGVFPSDCLPIKKLKKPAFVVANTDDRYSPGQHWVSFWFPKNVKNGDNSIGYYFDSFGTEPVNKHFLKFLKTNCKKFISNTQQLQGNFSSTCGHWCCMYYYYTCRGRSLKEFLKMFSKKNLDLNDKKVVHLYMKHLINQPKSKTKVNTQKGGKKFRVCQSCRPRIS